MDALFKELKIYASQGQLYEPVDHDLLLSYVEAKDGQILEEGITEAGGTASWIAAATSYATRGVPMVPFFTFYSMFGFQRVGDLIWSAADSRARGFLLGATAGRTTLAGEGLQHQDGHSLVLASTVPVCEAYDPAFAYEMATIIERGLHRMYVDNDDVFYYLTLYNENYTQPPMPDGSSDGIIRGLYRWAPAPEDTTHRATILFSGTAQQAARQAQVDLAEHYDVGVGIVECNVVQETPRGSPRSRTLESTPPRARPSGPLRDRATLRVRWPVRGGDGLHEGRTRPGGPLDSGPVHASRDRRVRSIRPRVKPSASSSRPTLPMWSWPYSRLSPTMARYRRRS